jgi:hypothetical protein
VRVRRGGLRTATRAVDPEVDGNGISMGRRRLRSSGVLPKEGCSTGGRLARMMSTRLGWLLAGHYHRRMITLEQLEDMFAGIARDGAWDLTRSMLWGYFFTDASAGKLERLIAPLADRGCRFVDIFEADVAEGNQPYFFLHVEKAEVHTARSLFARNAELYALADEHGVDAYDGMDVGPVPPNLLP